MQNIVRTGLLYDFYEKLLTDKQRTVLGFYLNDDYSLAEISEKIKISRQAVHDIIKRTTLKLEDFEQKLCLYKNLKVNRQLSKELITQIELGNRKTALSNLERIVEG